MKRMRALTALLTLAAVYTLSACLPARTQPPTAEERELQQEMIKAMTQRLQRQPQVSVTPAPASTLPTASEEQLRNAIATLATTEHAVYRPRKDGFDVNGRAYLDPEGKIVAFQVNPQLGDVTYLVETGPRSYVIKFTRPLAGTTPLILASAERTGRWTVRTVSGQTLSGRRLIMTSRGFVVARDDSAFRYIPGEGVRNMLTKEGFQVAVFQNGDIVSTGYMLLERIKDNSQSGGLLSSMKSLGSTLGINKKEDYLLVGLDSGMAYPINISIEDKESVRHSECQKKNTFVNKCARADFIESLYNQNGSRNYSHYYWRINWFISESGPILLAQENGLKDITFTNLSSGKKVTALSRTLGIAGYDLESNTNGGVRLVAQMGFSKETIEDVEKFLNEAPTQVAAP